MGFVGAPPLCWMLHSVPRRHSPPSEPSWVPSLPFTGITKFVYDPLPGLFSHECISRDRLSSGIRQNTSYHAWLN